VRGSAAGGGGGEWRPGHLSTYPVSGGGGYGGLAGWPGSGWAENLGAV